MEQQNFQQELRFLKFESCHSIPLETCQKDLCGIADVGTWIHFVLA